MKQVEANKMKKNYINDIVDKHSEIFIKTIDDIIKTQASFGKSYLSLEITDFKRIKNLNCYNDYFYHRSIPTTSYATRKEAFVFVVEW